MMSKFASNIKICVGKIKASEEGVVVFEMQCDNEENNIFCVKENELHGKISHLYGYDYVCRSYCFTKALA